MDTVASRVRDGKPGVVPVPGSVGRLNGTEGPQEAVQAGTQASRDAQRHLRDVLADLRQCDSAGRGSCPGLDRRGAGPGRCIPDPRIITQGRLANAKEFGVELGAQSHDSSASIGGKPTVMLVVHQLPSANALSLDRDVRVKMAELARLHLHGRMSDRAGQARCHRSWN